MPESIYIPISIDDLPPAISLNNTDVFMLDQVGGDGYTKKVTFETLYTSASAEYNFIKETGDTMTGPLSLYTVTPSDDYEAAAKGYVDGFVPLAGGTMTGPLSLYTVTPVDDYEAAAKGYVDNNFLSLSGGALVGPLSLSGDPVSALEAVTKQYVDNLVGDGAYLPLTGGTVTGNLTASVLSAGTFYGPQVAKAWVRFNGRGTTGTAGISASFNVSSVAVEGQGMFRINWAQSFDTVNYVVVGNAGDALYSGEPPNVGIFVGVNPSKVSTDHVIVETEYENGSNRPVESVHIVAFGY